MKLQRVVFVKSPCLALSHLMNPECRVLTPFWGALWGPTYLAAAAHQDTKVINLPCKPSTFEACCNN